MSKAKKDRKGSAGARGRVKPIDSASANKAGPKISPESRPMNMSQIPSDDRVARARQRINDGFYDRDEVRRVIAEALMFVLGTHRD